MARKAPPKAPPKKAVKARKPTSHAGGTKKAEPAPAKPALTRDLAAPEVIVVRSGRVACDGVGGALGHPRVWLEMGEADFVECPYCDRRFVLAAGSSGAEDERLAPGVYEGGHGH
jgi:uncharacterized Zn-finger protein